MRKLPRKLNFFTIPPAIKLKVVAASVLFVALLLVNQFRIILESSGQSEKIDDFSKTFEAASGEPFRDLPYVSRGRSLKADWIMNSTTGSFWLPRPPPDERRISGYEFRKLDNKRTKGFVRDDGITIMMWPGFNAGDFIAYYLTSLISGRLTATEPPPRVSRSSIAVVGSILQGGARYSWGAGFIGVNDKLKPNTEVIFAARGPVSYEQVLKSREGEAGGHVQVSRVFGDAGSLMSWFYQPHDQEKDCSLCIMPHLVDAKSPFVAFLLDQWKGSRVIDITGPLFSLLDEIVKCEFVLSSTLHGIIFSDSYGIPNAHMKLSDKVKGEYHKFDDYSKVFIETV